MKPAAISEGTISSNRICKDIQLANALLSYTVARRPMPEIRPRAERIVMRASMAGAAALVALSAAGALP